MPGDATDRPGFSIVVPIAPGRAPVVLDSLDRLERPAGCEVLTQVGPNPSRNRNQSIGRARGAILAFTDDDCQVAPDWLARAAAFFAAHPDYDVVGGPQLNTADEGALGRAGGHALASWFGAWRHCRRYRRAPRRLAATQRDLTSANLFVTRRAFERWGPFDERLGPNEETALLRRIETAGGRIAYDPAIVVFHKRRPSLRELARQCFGYGRGRARQSRIEGRRLPGLGQLVPSLFLVYLALLPMVAPAWPPAALPLAVYAMLGLGVAAMTAVVARDPLAALFMPLVFLVIHTAYPAGFLAAAVRPRRDAERARPQADATAPPAAAIASPRVPR
jgi:succinoglycan biosynthesis protein ExoA